MYSASPLPAASYSREAAFQHGVNNIKRVNSEPATLKERLLELTVHIPSNSESENHRNKRPIALSVGLGGASMQLEGNPKRTNLHKTNINIEFVSRDILRHMRMPSMRSTRERLDMRFAGCSLDGSQGKIAFAKSGRGSPVAVKIFPDRNGFRGELELTKKAKGAAHSVNLRNYGILGKHNKSAILMDKAGESDLFNILDSRAAGLSEAEALHLTKQMLECLNGLQDRKIIHRDIKPENIVWDEENKQYVLIDFGLASVHSESEEQSSGGTLLYASPEQILGLKAEFCQDIWSLGCTIFAAYKKEPLFYAYKDFDDKRTAFLLEMENLFGELPEAILKKVPSDIKKRLLQNRNVLKKENLPNFEGRIRYFPPSLKRLLGQMLSYENRPTARELLEDEAFKGDVGFRLDFPDRFCASELIIESEVDQDHRLQRTSISLGKKKCRKICYHIPRSHNDKYKIKLIDRYGRAVFISENFTIMQGGMLQIS